MMIHVHTLSVALPSLRASPGKNPQWTPSTPLTALAAAGGASERTWVVNHPLPSGI